MILVNTRTKALSVVWSYHLVGRLLLSNIIMLLMQMWVIRVMRIVAMRVIIGADNIIAYRTLLQVVLMSVLWCLLEVI